MHEIVLPNDTNLLGNVLGGRVMHLMEMCAAMSAYKHARTAVVTASIDRLDFLAPSKMGDIMKLQSSVNFTRVSSMEVGVKIESEKIISIKGKKELTSKNISVPSDLSSAAFFIVAGLINKNSNIRALIADHWKSLELIKTENLKKIKIFCLIHSKEINHEINSSLNRIICLQCYYYMLNQ